MKYLLDTHTLLWFLEDNAKLSKKTKALIETFDNDINVSVTTWFEISVKLTTGKLILPDSLSETILKSNFNQITTIGISEEHTISYQKLPLFANHKDPFDRMILATAITEGYSLISRIQNFTGTVPW
ncbi:type II toxin-antitoxin system VapC family toxin [Dyadobacter aurulentus]|uniref:type II toxin-antitoxin system VapC family toxin n=1 Tax=Dyadobacter sp. UC 10 TaxID=2605428 RepID=UPI0011F17258|nr:type II toxin-antitoxin system VapC family toxin [Dyadobacter sp. UC 10]KAA0989600.1 type II toxin-antitoxin system VapC family toxin [Dyadobacter sp. UC 10]